MFYGSNKKAKEVSGITLLRLPPIISQANPLLPITTFISICCVYRHNFLTSLSLGKIKNGGKAFGLPSHQEVELISSLKFKITLGCFVQENMVEVTVCGFQGLALREM